MIPIRQKSCFLALILLANVLLRCRSNPHQAKNIETEMAHSQGLGDETVGVRNGDLIIQRKIAVNEELRRLQYTVYELEDRVYGNRQYGSKGLYGALKNCREELVSKRLGGNGKLMWTEPIERVTEKEDNFTIGIDEKDKIVSVSEEFLKDRLNRFQSYRKTLLKRQTEYEEKLEICDAELKAKKEGMASATP